MGDCVLLVQLPRHLTHRNRHRPLHMLTRLRRQLQLQLRQHFRHNLLCGAVGGQLAEFAGRFRADFCFRVGEQTDVHWNDFLVN